MYIRLLGTVATVLLLASPVTAAAQQAGRGAAPPATPRAAAAIDLTGYWVSVIVEDWKWRMVTPKKGVYEAIPLNAEGRKVADTWDPAKDEASGEQCRSYGAAAIMRVPGRLRITWEDDNTLKVETDAGAQTRLFHFGPSKGGQEAPTWQGDSVASWEVPRGTGPRGEGGVRDRKSVV